MSFNEKSYKIKFKHTKYQIVVEFDIKAQNIFEAYHEVICELICPDKWMLEFLQENVKQMEFDLYSAHICCWLLYKIRCLEKKSLTIKDWKME